MKFDNITSMTCGAYISSQACNAHFAHFVVDEAQDFVAHLPLLYAHAQNCGASIWIFLDPQQVCNQLISLELEFFIYSLGYLSIKFAIGQICIASIDKSIASYFANLYLCHCYSRQTQR